MFPAESNAGSPERCYPPSVAVLRARWLLAVAQGLHLPYNCTCPISAPIARPYLTCTSPSGPLSQVDLSKLSAARKP